MIMDDDIKRNMYCLLIYSSRNPHCIECGYYKMTETCHERFIDGGGMSYYKCKNCGFECSRKDIQDNFPNWFKDLKL
jgi:hypothetical protein